MVIAEHNQLNWIDQSMQYLMKQEQIKLRKQGYHAEFPPFFRDKEESSDSSGGSVLQSQH